MEEMEIIRQFGRYLSKLCELMASFFFFERSRKHPRLRSVSTAFWHFYRFQMQAFMRRRERENVNRKFCLVVSGSFIVYVRNLNKNYFHADINSNFVRGIFFRLFFMSIRERDLQCCVFGSVKCSRSKVSRKLLNGDCELRWLTCLSTYEKAYMVLEQRYDVM